MDYLSLLAKYLEVLEKINRNLMGRFSMADMGDVSLVLGMRDTRDREKKTISVTQKTTPSPCWSDTGW